MMWDSSAPINRPTTMQRAIGSFNKAFKEDKELMKGFLSHSPSQRDTKRQIEIVDLEQQNTIKILKTVSVFANLGVELLKSIALSLEKVNYKKGDSIIIQDDVGDDFYIIERGTVIVRRKGLEKGKGRWPRMVSRDIAKIGEKSFFGELSLLTREKRSASIVVSSPTCQCLKMTKSMFEEVVNEAEESKNATLRGTVSEVIEENEAIKKLFPPEYRKALVQAMKVIHFPSNSYIIRQDTQGKMFYVIVDGECKVTSTDKGTLIEKEVMRYKVGDSFGFEAMIDSEHRRKYNVLSVSASVSIMVLFLEDFQRIKGLSDNSKKLIRSVEKKNRSGGGEGSLEDDATIDSENYRRVTAYDEHNVKDKYKTVDMMKRMVHFITDSLYASLYWKMYKVWIIKPEDMYGYGSHPQHILSNKHVVDRSSALSEIITTVHWILNAKPSDRTDADVELIAGLLKMIVASNDVGFCKGWTQMQYEELARRVYLVQVPFLKPIYEAGAQGTCAYLLLKGCVRSFQPVNSNNNNSSSPTSSASSSISTVSIGHASRGMIRGYSERTRANMYKYYLDLMPGEFLGEQVLGGMTNRLLSMLAVSPCDLLAINTSDYLSIAESNGEKQSMMLGEKFDFLKTCSLFSHYDDYHLCKLAGATQKDEIKKEDIVLTKGGISNSLYFIVQGKLDILSDLDDKSILAVLHKCDYFGESSALRHFNPSAPQHKQGGKHHLLSRRDHDDRSKKVNQNAGKQQMRFHYLETFVSRAGSSMDVLVLKKQFFKLLDSAVIEQLQTNYFSRTHYRQKRANLVEAENTGLQLANKMKLSLISNFSGGASSSSSSSSLSRNPLASSGSLSSIPENSQSSLKRSEIGGSLLSIPHLDSCLDPLVFLANGKTTNDMKRRLQYLKQVEASEKFREKQYVEEKSHHFDGADNNNKKKSLSPGSKSPSLPPVTNTRANKTVANRRVPFLPRSRSSLRGTKVGRFPWDSEEDMDDEDGDDEVTIGNGASDDDISVGSVANSVNTTVSLPVGL